MATSVRTGERWRRSDGDPPPAHVLEHFLLPAVDLLVGRQAEQHFVSRRDEPTVVVTEEQVARAHVDAAATPGVAAGPPPLLGRLLRAYSGSCFDLEKS